MEAPKGMLEQFDEGVRRLGGAMESEQWGEPEMESEAFSAEDPEGFHQRLEASAKSKTVWNSSSRASRMVFSTHFCGILAPKSSLRIRFSGCLGVGLRAAAHLQPRIFAHVAHARGAGGVRNGWRFKASKPFLARVGAHGAPEASVGGAMV